MLLNKHWRVFTINNKDLEELRELLLKPVGRCIPVPIENEDHIMDALNYSIKSMGEHTMNEPDYYAGNGLSPIGAMKQGLISKEEYVGFLKGNIIKYVVRAEHKENPVKDLLKARNYIDFYLDIFNVTEEEQELIQEPYQPTPNDEEA